MLRALLLSPDDQAVSAITGVLEEMSVSCERPLDGASAAQKLNSHNFELVLVDCENLPAAKLIFDVCRRATGSPVPIAIVDGRAGLPTAFRLGAELILTKPVAKDQARGTIRIAVGRARKDETARPVAMPEVPSLSAAAAPLAPAPPEERAQAAAAMVSSPPPESCDLFAATAQKTAPAPVLTPKILEPALAPGPVPKVSPAVKEDVAPPPAPAAPPAPKVVPSAAAARSRAVLPGFEPEPKEKLGDDPVLAEIDKVERGEIAPRTPVLSSFHKTPPPKKRGGRVAVLLLLLAGGGFYAAWMYQPGFREMVEPQIVRVLEIVQPQIDHLVAFVEQVTQHSTQPRTPAAVPAPTQHAPQGPQSATPAEPTNTANTTPSAGGTVAADATAGTPSPPPSTPANPLPAAGPETVETAADSQKTTAAASLESAPAMDKNVVILSSKGAEKRLVHRVAPVYPRTAKSLGAEATVVLRTLVDESGTVVNVSVVEGNAVLAAAATRAVKQWRYRPYARGGENLAFQTIVLVDFQRK